jgi:hypothetical protein
MLSRLLVDVGGGERERRDFVPLYFTIHVYFLSLVCGRIGLYIYDVMYGEDISLTRKKDTKRERDDI